VENFIWGGKMGTASFFYSQEGLIFLNETQRIPAEKTDMNTYHPLILLR